MDTDIYNMPNETVTDVVDLIGWTVYASDGILFPILIFVTGVIIFLATKAFSIQIAFATSTFIVALLSILATIMGFMNPTYMYFSFVLFGLSLLALRASK